MAFFGWKYRSLILLSEWTLFCQNKLELVIGEFQNWWSDPMNSTQSTRCSLFLGLTLDPFKQNKVHTPFQKQIVGLKLMCSGGIFKEFLSMYIHFWQMTTVVSTCLEKWEFLKFVIIWKAETWLQTQKSEYCTSLHCTTLQCNTKIKQIKMLVVVSNVWWFVFIWAGLAVLF